MARSIWQAAEAYPRKNVMTSLLWLCALTFPGGALALLVKPWPGVWVFIVGTLCVLCTIAYYIFWSMRDPDRLQTEDYRIHRDYVSRISEISNISSDHFAPRDATLVPRLGQPQLHGVKGGEDE